MNGRKSKLRRRAVLSVAQTQWSAVALRVERLEHRHRRRVNALGRRFDKYVPTDLHVSPVRQIKKHFLKGETYRNSLLYPQ